MVDKDKLMQILQKFDVDELWVSFDDLYSADHTNSNDCVLAVKKNATYADQDFKRIWAPLMQFLHQLMTMMMTLLLLALA